MARDVRTANETAPSDRTVRTLITDLTEQFSRLARAEIALAKRELAQHAKKAGIGAGVLAAAALLGFLGACALLAAVILAIALVLPAWAAALIVGGALVFTAAVLGGVGAVLLRRHGSPMPDTAWDNAKYDVEVLRRAVTDGGATTRG